MIDQEKVSGVILAGGLARRMDYQDKGLICFDGKPMISYAIAAMSAVVDQLMINANRNIEQYQHFGLPVITDQTDSFNGPLAGILTAMNHTKYSTLLVMPCDSPLILPSHLRKLILTRTKYNADVAVAFDGKRLHPVFLAIKTDLQAKLQDYLARNEFKVELWLKQQRMVKVDFKNDADIFVNINTLADLFELQARNPQAKTPTRKHII